MKALVVTGSRSGINDTKEYIFEILLPSVVDSDIDLIIHGAAPGVDSIFDEYAQKNNIQVLKMPACWDEYGKLAGPKRNQEMINLALCLQNCGWEITCLAIPGPNSKGTYGCLKLMKEAGFHGKVLKVGK